MDGGAMLSVSVSAGAPCQGGNASIAVVAGVDALARDGEADAAVGQVLELDEARRAQGGEKELRVHVGANDSWESHGRLLRCTVARGRACSCILF